MSLFLKKKEITHEDIVLIVYRSWPELSLVGWGARQSCVLRAIQLYLGIIILKGVFWLLNSAGI